MNIGDMAQEFDLPDTTGRVIGLPHGAAATVVVFTTNHCPYARAWHDRIAATAKDYHDNAVRFVAISPNDPEQFPDDSLDAMRDRVEQDGGWLFPYAIDEDGSVARSYGATKTPELFVFDEAQVLRYHGAPDGDHEDPSLNAQWLRQALDAVLAGATPSPEITEPVGCTIKWKPA